MIAQARSSSGQRNIILQQDFFQRVGGDLEQLRAAEAAHLPSDRQMRLEAYKTIIATVMQVQENCLKLPIAFAGRYHFTATQQRVFHVNVDGIRLKRWPIIQRLLTGDDEVREIKCAAKLR